MKIPESKDGEVVDRSTQSLKIQNCKFQNIFYEIGSIVRLPNQGSGWPWSVEITNTTFENLSFCGSIISNEFHDIKALTFSNSSIEQEILEFVNYQNFHEFGLISNGTQRTTKNCEVEDCFSFKFENNTIRKLNALKYMDHQEQLFKEMVSHEMQKFGLAIHLKDYHGDFILKNNIFEQNLLKFTDSARLSYSSG